MTSQMVKDYYTSQVRQEWRRLVRDAYQRLELDTTLHFLKKHLPKSGQVLDAGGGPGRYTIELAQRGYDMTLLDMTPANLAFARRRVKQFGLQEKVGQIVEGRLQDLSMFPENSFDAVLCLGGPLSHILKPAERQAAIRELVRVAKPGAPIFVSVMSRLSLITLELIQFPNELELPFYQKVRDSGDYPGGYGFTACHFFLPEEFRQSFEGQGVDILELVGLEGLGTHHRRQVTTLAKNPKRWKVWWQTHLKTCTHPSVVGISEHMLLVAHKN